MSSNRNDNESGAAANAGGAQKPMPNGEAPQKGGTGAAKAPQALDRWIDDQLNKLFNDVSSEPLPPDLARLIGQLRAQSQK